MQTAYNRLMPVGRPGMMSDISIHNIQSLVNGSSLAETVEITVASASDTNYLVTVTIDGIAYDTTFAEGAAGTTTTKQAGLVAAINANPDLYGLVRAVKTAATKFKVYALNPTTNITVGHTVTIMTSATTQAYVGATSIAFGQAVAYGTVDGQGVVFSANTQKLAGVAIAISNIEQAVGLTGYPAGSVMNVMDVGHVWVTVETAVVQGDPAFVRMVATGSEVAGAFRNTDDSTDCQKVVGAKFTSSAAAGGLAILSLVGTDLALQSAPSGSLVVAQAQATATTTYPAFSPNYDGEIVGFRYYNATGLAADASNYFTLQLKRGATVVAEWSTETGQEGTIAAATWVSGVLVPAEVAFEAGDVFTIVATETGTATLPAGSFQIDVAG